MLAGFFSSRELLHSQLGELKIEITAEQGHLNNGYFSVNFVMKRLGSMNKTIAVSVQGGV